MYATRSAALGALLVFGSCGGGGGGGGSAGGSIGLANGLALVSHSPAHESIDNPTGARVRLNFDGSVVASSLGYAETGLFAGAQRIQGQFRLESGGRTVVFTPDNPLSEQTDYQFRLAPLTCDGTGRILDHALTFDFRTIDTVPPSVASATVSPGQVGVHRSDAILIDFDEEIHEDTVTGQSVQFIDQFGGVVSANGSVTAKQLSVAPAVDLAGDTEYSLRLSGGAAGVSDRSGNHLPAAWSVGFRTANDTSPPFVVSTWPSSGNPSPMAHVRVQFSESIDLSSVGPASVLFIDDGANLVPFTVSPSADQHSLRFAPNAPLTPGKVYGLGIVAGAGGVTDMSGNPASWAYSMTFTVGADSTPPLVVSTYPGTNEVGVSPNAVPVISFDEPVDPASVTPGVIQLYEGTEPVPAVISMAAGDLGVTVTPNVMLSPARQYSVVVRGGHDGVRDYAGNPLSADLNVPFHTTTDGTVPSVMLLPSDGLASVPFDTDLVAVFDQPIDPTTVTAASVFVTGPGSAVIPGALTVHRGDRVVRFVPTTSLASLQWYTMTVLGGPNGVAESSGNYLANTQSTTFRTSTSADMMAPIVTCTLNDIDQNRNGGLTVPPSGFHISVEASDLSHFAQDLSTVNVTITGQGRKPSSNTIFGDAVITESTLSYTVPQSWALSPGLYQVQAEVHDLSGNVGRSSKLSFRVEPLDSNVLPFERPQVMWVRFHMDRDNNGREDIKDDLLRLGLMAAGDPAGTNGRMISLMRDGILAACNTIFGRDPSGTPLGGDSIPVRLTHQRPLGLTYSSIACAGMDPEGTAGRTYGSASTGVLGRAYFDYRNNNIADHNTALSPGLGVFPAEVFFFESNIHIQVGSSFLTSFGLRFRRLCPPMGGTAAGADPLDPIVLAATFDYASATSAEQSRYDTIFDALDDWSKVVATVLAHEVGHSVGLVAQGGNPLGLHGDSSLHNEFAALDNVMAAALGYDSMVVLPHRYRDVNAAYLRQRLMMK